MSQRCMSCGRETPGNDPLQHYPGCDCDPMNKGMANAEEVAETKSGRGYSPFLVHFD